MHSFHVNIMFTDYVICMNFSCLGMQSDQLVNKGVCETDDMKPLMVLAIAVFLLIIGCEPKTVESPATD